MRLISFHVKTFRNVIDSTEVAVDHVTCLVGKNEAGKSAVLQALHALNPAKPDQSLTLLDEYPRWLKKEHEITGEIESAVPITATFGLTDDEVAGITERFGATVLSSSQFTASRSYAEPNTIQVQASIDYKAFLSAFIGSLPQRVKKAVGSELTTSDELISALKKLVADQGSEDAGGGPSAGH